MLTAEDLISEEAVDDNDLEIIREGDEQDIETVEREDGEENEGETEATLVKPKRVIRNPQPKLNEETLKGPRGINAIESYFERTQFKGRGHEEEDLSILLKTYEYWCHRLFPKFAFDECITRIERLGSKKAIQTHIKKIRMDMLFDDDKPLISDNDDDGEGNNALIVNDNNSQFEELMDEMPIEINEEQQERMRLNKERAERIRRERSRKLQKDMQTNLEQSINFPVDDNAVDSSSQNLQNSSEITSNVNDVDLDNYFDDNQGNTLNELNGTEEGNEVMDFDIN